MKRVGIAELRSRSWEPRWGLALDPGEGACWGGGSSYLLLSCQHIGLLGGEAPAPVF